MSDTPETAPLPPGLVDCYMAALEFLFPDPAPDRVFSLAEREQIKDLTRQLWREQLNPTQGEENQP
jgi:hypothetical protein